MLTHECIVPTLIKGFGLTPLSGDHRAYMPPLLKTKQNIVPTLVPVERSVLTYLDPPPYYYLLRTNTDPINITHLLPTIPILTLAEEKTYLSMTFAE